MTRAANSPTAPNNAETLPPDLAQVKQLAATGHYRAIAFWLNQALMTQGVYAHVQADDRPGCLRILIEFKRQPKKEVLMRLICSRIWKLNSDIIEGIYVTARFIGQSRHQWQRRVRVLSPAFRQKHEVQPPRPLSQPDSKPTPIDINALAIRRRDTRRHRMIFKSRAVIDQQFKLLRAVVITGSATAAFILGCITEIMISGHGPNLPQFGSQPSDHIEGQTNTEPADTLSDGPVPDAPLPDATEISFAHRYPEPRTVTAPLEPVAVVSHTQVPNPADPNITLLFGGEVTLGDLNIKSQESADQLFGDISAYPQADIAMVSLGNPLATAGTSLQEEYYRRTHLDAVTALREGGVDIVGLTSDRTLHYGEQGLLETLETLDQEGIYRVGAGRDHREARRPEILEVKGQRIAYLGYTPDGVNAAQADKAGINVQDKAAIIEDIAALRNDVDWIVVNYRWLGKLDQAPSPQQVRLARTAIDAGADLVVGYHPEQLQGAELYKERPIVYSLGDFIFADAPLDDRDTAALRVSLRAGQMKVEFLPITVRKAQPRAARGDKGEAILRQLREASDPLEAPLVFPAILDAQPHPKAPKPAQPAPTDRAVPTTPTEADAPKLIPHELELAPTPDSLTPDGLTPDGLTPDSLTPETSAPNETAPKESSPSRSEPESEPAPTLRDSMEPIQELEWAPFPINPAQETRQPKSPGQAPRDRTDSFTEEDFIDPDSELAPDISPSESSPKPSGVSPAADDEALDDWGPKTDARDLESGPDLQAIPAPFPQPNQPSIGEVVPTPAQIPAAEGAIKPYGEPLVGPLTQRLTQPSDQTAALPPKLSQQLTGDNSPKLTLLTKALPVKPALTDLTSTESAVTEPASSASTHTPSPALAGSSSDAANASELSQPSELLQQ
ncbi:MAG: CapA family protein [Cyanobacteria bacterium P01_F01_bin.4]